MSDSEVKALRRKLRTAVGLLRQLAQDGESCASVTFALVPRPGCKCRNCAGIRFIEAYDKRKRTGAGTAAKEGE